MLIYFHLCEVVFSSDSTHILFLSRYSLFCKKPTLVSKLSPTDRQNIDSLLVPDSVENTNANLNLLKSPPKSHKLKYIKELQDKFDTMMLVGDAQKLLSFIPATKVKSFAALARTLDISEFNDFRLPKRRTLLLCLLYQAQVKTRDHMVEMFLKRIKKIHNNAKTKLEPTFRTSKCSIK